VSLVSLSMTSHTRSRLVLLIFLLIVLILITDQVLPASVGTSDFLGYWAGTRLLLRGQDPYEADNILRVQREAFPDRDHPMYTWNPPWLGVLLLPLGALPFQQAATIWLVTNTLLIGACSLSLWWLFDRPESSSRLWLALPIAFLFPQTITALDTGQTTAFMLLGVSGFLVAYRLERWGLAGALLALTTIKPHLVFLWLPLVLLWTLGQRRWKVWLGFGLMLGLWIAVLTWLLPSWPKDYSAILRAPPTNWATPTVGGLMAMAWGTSWGRYVGLLLLPVIVLVWWRMRHRRLEIITAALLPVSLALAIFGWSYDQILLLLLLIAVAVSLVRRELSARDTAITASLVGLIVAALLVQRLESVNEVYYAWAPWAVLLVGAWTAWRRFAGGALPRGAAEAGE
jgi:hypothetical protein